MRTTMRPHRPHLATEYRILATAALVIVTLAALGVLAARALPLRVDTPSPKQEAGRRPSVGEHERAAIPTMRTPARVARFARLYAAYQDARPEAAAPLARLASPRLARVLLAHRPRPTLGASARLRLASLVASERHEPSAPYVTYEATYQRGPLRSTSTITTRIHSSGRVEIIDADELVRTWS